jgi:predicted nucleotidyltransferase
MNTEKLLAELVERLLKTYSRDLRSVVLYGSAATGDFHQKHSDLNVLCVVRALDVEKLEKYEPIANWWRGAAGSAPLLLSE